MITARDLATIRVAVQYWYEEMAPNGVHGMRTYYLHSTAEPHSPAELRSLRKTLQSLQVRYVGMTDGAKQLTDQRIWQSVEKLAHELPGAKRATLLLPPG